MPAIQILSRPEFQRLSVTLLHFLWQGVAVAAVTIAVIYAMRLGHGGARHAAYLLSLLAMLACPIVTYMTIQRPTAPVIGRIESFSPAIHPDDLAAVDVQAIPLNGANRIAAPAPHVAEPMSWRDDARVWLTAAMPWVPAAWCIGVLMLSARLLTGLAGTWRWKKGASELPAPLLARVDKLSARIGLPGFRRIVASPRIAQPSAVGFWRPVVILPLALVAQMPPEMLDAVIAHELAHVRRLDPLVNLVQRLIETLLFYHPAVWWVSGQIRREREICCDAMAVAVTERMTYVSALEHVARFTLGLSPTAYVQGVSLAFGGRRRQVLQRITHLLELPAPRTGAAWPAGALALLLVVVGISVSRSAGQKPTTAPAATGSDDSNIDGGAKSDRSAREARAIERRARLQQMINEAQAAGQTTGAETQGARDTTGASDRLPTPSDEAKEEARQQAMRGERLAELDVQEAKLNLEGKQKDLDRASAAHKKGLASDEEVDRDRLAVKLGQIQLERTEIELEVAKEKTQNLNASSVQLRIQCADHMDGFEAGFVVSIRTRKVTLKQLLSQGKDTLDKNETRGDGKLTLFRKKDNFVTQKVLDAVPVQDVLNGKIEDQVLRAGDMISVMYDLQLARKISIIATDAKPGSASWPELPRRNMTLTQVLSATKYDLKSIADQKVTLLRTDSQRARLNKVIDAVPLRDLLDGAVKDEVVQSGDRIAISK